MNRDELDKLLANANIKTVDDGAGGFGKDLQAIAKEYNSDDNVFRFAIGSKRTIVYDALLGALGCRPHDRYELISKFRFFYAINSSTVKGLHNNSFQEIVGSLMAFRGALEWKQAGVNIGMQSEEKKHSLLDKIRKG